jgi:hypothetical protein
MRVPAVCYSVLRPFGAPEMKRQLAMILSFVHGPSGPLGKIGDTIGCVGNSAISAQGGGPDVPPGHMNGQTNIYTNNGPLLNPVGSKSGAPGAIVGGIDVLNSTIGCLSVVRKNW